MVKLTIQQARQLQYYLDIAYKHTQPGDETRNLVSLRVTLERGIEAAQNESGKQSIPTPEERQESNLQFIIGAIVFLIFAIGFAILWAIS